ncbi:unnamed protein product [Arctogadus glacialis]
MKCVDSPHGHSVYSRRFCRDVVVDTPRWFTELTELTDFRDEAGCVYLGTAGGPLSSSGGDTERVCV